MKGFRFVLAMTAIAVLAAPASAQANFHLMKVREVYPGSVANPGAEYVVLQMYAAGQNVVSGHKLTVYDPCGFSCDTGTLTFGANAPNSNDQQTILVGTATAQTQFGVSPDAALPAPLDPAGGAVCFATEQATPVDCVAWGSFTDSAGVGTPAAAIPDGMALQRTIAPNCSTLLEPADDTNNSATDFFSATPNPRNNASAMPEHACLPPDTTPPDTMIESGASGVVSSTSASFTFESSEAGSSFECALDSAAFAACSSPQDYTGLGQGSHTFQVRATDGSANTDPTPASRSFTVDTVAPDTTISSGPSGPIASTSASFTFESTEAGSSVMCRLDLDAFSACSSPMAYTGLSEGTHNFSVYATDGAFNFDDSPAIGHFIVDTMPPNTTIDFGPVGVTNDATPTFGFHSPFHSGDPTTVPGFQCKVDRAAYASCSSAKTTGRLAQGTHTFYVRAVDGAGNADPTPGARTFTVDTTPPNTTITGITFRSTTAVVRFSGSDNRGGLGFECKLDSGAYARCSSPKTYKGLAVGSHRVWVRAIDAAKNVDATPASKALRIPPPG